jgi:hypothetical protein
MRLQLIFDLANDIIFCLFYDHEYKNPKPSFNNPGGRIVRNAHGPLSRRASGPVRQLADRSDCLSLGRRGHGIVGV